MQQGQQEWQAANEKAAKSKVNILLIWLVEIEKNEYKRQGDYEL